MGALGKGLMKHEEEENNAAKEGVAFNSKLLSHCHADYRKGRVQRSGIPLHSSTVAFLADFPQGYAMFNGKRPQPNGPEHFDIYIYGSLKGEFDSIVSFIPHLYWLMKGQREDVLCRCKLCCRCVHCTTECSGCERPTGSVTRRRRRSESPSPSPHQSISSSSATYASASFRPTPPLANSSTFAPVAGPSSVARGRNWSSISDNDMDISD